MPDAVCLSLKITFGQMEMQKLFTRKRKDPIEALQEQMRSIMEGHGAVTFGVQKLSYRCCSEITRTVCIGTTTRYYPHYEQYRLPKLSREASNPPSTLRKSSKTSKISKTFEVLSWTFAWTALRWLRSYLRRWKMAWWSGCAPPNLGGIWPDVGVKHGRIFTFSWHSYSRPFDSLFNYIYIYTYIFYLLSPCFQACCAWWVTWSDFISWHGVDKD